jgi:hypothetical protein
MPRVANDLTEDYLIRASCGETLAEIWITNNQFDLDSLLKLIDVAKSEALGLIKSKKPNWYEEYLKRVNISMERMGKLLLYTIKCLYA